MKVLDFMLLFRNIFLLFFCESPLNMIKSLVVYKENDYCVVYESNFDDNLVVFKKFACRNIKYFREDIAKEFTFSKLFNNQNIIRFIGTFETRCGCYSLIYEKGEKTLFMCDFYTLYEIKKVIFDLLSGVSAIHRGGVLHNDLKEDNVVKIGNTYKIIDFGIASFYDPSQNYDFEFQPGNYYPQVAPEVFNKGRVDFKSDIYSIGNILECIFTKLLNNSPGHISQYDYNDTIRFIERLKDPSLKIRYSAEEALQDQWFNYSTYVFPDFSKYVDHDEAEFSKTGSELTIFLQNQNRIKIQTRRKFIFPRNHNAIIYFNDNRISIEKLGISEIELIDKAIYKLKKLTVERRKNKDRR